MIALLTGLVLVSQLTTSSAKKIKIDKGSGKPNLEKVGKISRADLEEIAKVKMGQLNAIDMDGAVKVIAGTARSMGVVVED